MAGRKSERPDGPAMRVLGAQILQPRPVISHEVTEAPIRALAAFDERQVMADIIEQAAFARERMRSDGDDERPGVVIEAVAKLRIGPRETGMLVDASVVSEPVEMIELDGAD